MAKILNLDKLAKGSDRKLTINGVDYPVLPMTVENFINTTRSIESMVEKGSTAAEQIDITLDLICSLVPTVPRGDLLKYELTMLNTIATFVRGEDVDEQEAVEGEAGK